MVTRNDDSRDDALGRRNSRIARNAAAGTYTAEATTYRAATAGSFRLTVRTLPTAPDKPANGRSSVGADDGLVTLSWNASAGAATHRVTLSGSSWSATVDAPAASQTVPASALAVRSGLRVAYVEACNAEGACSARTSIAFRPPPPAPSGIVAVADGSTEVDLTWRSVANATRYEVEYKTTASDAWIDHPGSTTATSTSVAGLECGTGHDFRVRAHGDGTNRASHWGPWSATASEDTEACVVNRPGAPANVALTVRDRQLEVAWDTPTSDGGSSVSGHQFRYRVHGTQTWTESAEYTTASTRSQRSPSDELDLAQRVIAGLGNGTEYDVEMRVKNANGYGSWTEQQPVSATPAAATIAIESIVDASLEVGGSTVFSVRAENLSTTVDYTIRLSTSATGGDAGVLKFNSCGTNAADAIDFLIGTNASAVTISGALTVYGCAAGSDDLTATLSGGTGTSTSATQAITVADTAFPTLTAPTATFAADGVTVDVDFTLPQDGLFYRLTLYRSTDGDNYTIGATSDPSFGDDSATMLTGFRPDTIDRYKFGFKTCRDAARHDCGTEAESSVFWASTVADVTVSDLTPSTIVAGMSVTSSVSVSNLDENQSYTLKTHTETRTSVYFDRCSLGENPKEFEPIENSIGYRRTGIVLYSCVDTAQRHEVYATLSIGDFEIARSDDLAAFDVTNVPLPEDVRVYGNGGSTGSVIVRWQPVDDALQYKLQFGIYDTTNDAWTWENTRTILDPVSRVITGNGTTRSFLEKTFDGLNDRHFYGVRMSVVVGVPMQSSVPSMPTSEIDAWFYVATSLPANVPPLASPIALNEWEYTICGSTLESASNGWTAGEWANDIASGLETWDRVVLWTLDDGNNIVSSAPASPSADCGGNALENGLVKGEPDLDNFRRASCLWQKEMGQYTDEQKRGKACTVRGTDDPLATITFWTGHSWNPGAGTPGSCSNVQQIAAHEGGHVFGVGAHTRRSDALMLGAPAGAVCSPTPWDVMLVIRSFQTVAR